MNKKLIIMISGATLIVLATSIPLAVIFTGETDPPQITKITPEFYAIVSGVTEISFNATDLGESPSGIGSHKIYIDDILVSKESTYDWDTTQYEDGTIHTIHIKVFDKKKEISRK